MPRRVLQGVVISDACDKTVTVRIERRFIHPAYKKTVRKHKKYHAHDENNTYKKGDIVKICECRPLSKTKTWEVIELINRSDASSIKITA